MASKLLSEFKIKNAKAGEKERLLTDGEGLYLRLRPAGKDWLFIYSLEGKRRKMGLGPYPAVSLDRAREKAQEARSTVADSTDPIAAREAAKVARKAAEAASASRHTVRSLFELWHKKELAKSRRDGGAEIRRAIAKDVLPELGDMFASDIKRAHLMAALDRILERGSLSNANKVLQYLRQMFRFAAVREIVAGDPTFGIRKKDVGGNEPERDRFLTEDEIRELAHKLPAAALSKPAETAVWAILSTCCRVGELSQARWSDIDFDHGIWTIPAEVAKNGRQHVIHLSAFALAQFEKLRAMATSETWLYPDSSGKSHVSTKSLQKQFRDRQRATALNHRTKAVGVLLLAGGEWTAHDLRRTGSTLMGELGVRPDVIERCLNHIGGDKLKNTYQLQQTMRERAEAFEVLGERLALLARGEKATVVTGRFSRKPREAA